MEDMRARKSDEGTLRSYRVGHPSALKKRQDCLDYVIIPTNSKAAESWTVYYRRLFARRNRRRVTLTHLAAHKSGRLAGTEATSNLRLGEGTGDRRPHWASQSASQIFRSPPRGRADVFGHT